MIKKLIIYGVIVFAVYQGASLYTTNTLAEKVSVCGARYGMPQHIEKSELTRKDFLASAKSWRCVKRDQNFLEALFFKVPDTWTNPPRPYVDPPFTDEELTDDFSINTEIQKDLQILSRAYEGESRRLNRIMNLLASGGKNRLDTLVIGQRYGEASKELALVAAKYSQIPLSTRTVDVLNRQFVSSLNRITSDGQELKLLLVSVNKDLEEGESILALSKSEIAENRSKLLEIQDRLARAEARLQTKIKALEKDRDDAMGALDALEALARKYGVSLS